VVGLCDRCYEFLRTQVVPSSVLRVLRVAKNLLLKAVFVTWRELMEYGKAMPRYRMMSLNDRRKRMEEMDHESSDAASVTSSRNIPSRRASSMASGHMDSPMTSPRSVLTNSNNASPTHAKRRRPSNQSQLSPMSRSDRQSVMSSSAGIYRDDASDFGDEFEDGVLDLAAAGARRGGFKAERSTFGGTSDTKVVLLCEEVITRCWRCIQEETGTVLVGPDLMDQDELMIQQILRLEQCTVPEIALFRAVHLWVRARCRAQGLPETAENLREQIREETLLLVRFAALTAEQIQWEVVPSGLLEYEDVQQLLYTISGRMATLSKYSAAPRSNKTLRSRNRSQTMGGLFSGKMQEFDEEEDEEEGGPMKAADTLRGCVHPVYSPVIGDPVDTLVGTELLRISLRRAVDEDAHRSGLKELVSEAAFREESSASRLPPITPRGALTSASSSRRGASLIPVPPLLPPPPSASASPRKMMSKPSSLASLSLSRDSSKMVLGLPPVLNDPATQHGFDRPERLSQASDFRRIERGLYRYRDKKLVEVWIERGVAMFKDHGSQALERLLPTELYGHGEAAVRRKLGLSEAPPIGGGLPLTSFFRCL